MIDSVGPADVSLIPWRARVERAAYRALVVITVIAPILVTFFAMWRLWGQMIGWTELALFLSLYFATGFGITIGFHRYLSHASFECGQPVK